MSRFRFEFDALLRYRRYRRDLVRQLLAGILADLANEDAARARLVDERADLLDELREITSRRTVDVDAASARRFHAGVVAGRIAETDARREIVMHQLTVCRGALVEADRDVRLLERLRERRRDEFRIESERADQRRLEDEWAASHGAVSTL